MRTFQMVLKWFCFNFWWKRKSGVALVFIFLYFFGIYGIFAKVLSRLTWQYRNVMLIAYCSCLQQKPRSIYERIQFRNLYWFDCDKLEMSIENLNVLEVGISHHHSLLNSALKSHLLQGNSKMKMCHLYETSNIDSVSKDLKVCLMSHVTYVYSCV